MPVEQAVLETVPEAAQALVAGRIAVGGAVLQAVEGVLEDLQAVVADPPGEARAAGQRVVR